MIRIVSLASVMFAVVVAVLPWWGVCAAAAVTGSWFYKDKSIHRLNVGCGVLSWLGPAIVHDVFSNGQVSRAIGGLVFASGPFHGAFWAYLLIVIVAALLSGLSSIAAQSAREGLEQIQFDWRRLKAGKPKG